jgi:predicted RNA binding protein YcfA (HicA-like mRNA interferase family)
VTRRRNVVTRCRNVVTRRRNVVMPAHLKFPYDTKGNHRQTKQSSYHTKGLSERFKPVSDRTKGSHRQFKGSHRQFKELTRNNKRLRVNRKGSALVDKGATRQSNGINCDFRLVTKLELSNEVKGSALPALDSQNSPNALRLRRVTSMRTEGSSSSWRSILVAKK